LWVCPLSCSSTAYVPPNRHEAHIDLSFAALTFIPIVESEQYHGVHCLGHTMNSFEKTSVAL
ncbi:hypothetical protein T12_16682, partial [Trichinella patagoniensis]